MKSDSTASNIDKKGGGAKSIRGALGLLCSAIVFVMTLTVSAVKIGASNIGTLFFGKKMGAKINKSFGEPVESFFCFILAALNSIVLADGGKPRPFATETTDHQCGNHTTGRPSTQEALNKDDHNPNTTISCEGVKQLVDGPAVSTGRA